MVGPLPDNGFSAYLLQFQNDKGNFTFTMGLLSLPSVSDETRHSHPTYDRIRRRNIRIIKFPRPAVPGLKPGSLAC